MHRKPQISHALCQLADGFYEASRQEKLLLLNPQDAALLSLLLCQLASRSLTMEEKCIKKRNP